MHVCACKLACEGGYVSILAMFNLLFTSNNCLGVTPFPKNFVIVTFSWASRGDQAAFGGLISYLQVPTRTVECTKSVIERLVTDFDIMGTWG